MTTIEDANFALQKVLDAGSKKNVIELAWIKNVRVTIPRVIVTLSLPSFANSQRDRIVQEVLFEPRAQCYLSENLRMMVMIVLL